MAHQLFSTSIAGSLPKPVWLSETNKLWPAWKAGGAELAQAKADATLLWIKAQEDAGLDAIGDGEQSRQHFVHGFLEQVEGIDFEHKVKMGIRDNRYDAMVPQVVSALCLRGRVHAVEARLLRAHTTRKIKFTLPGPMTIVDTVADRFYGDKVKLAMAFAELLNQEALALQADGVDIIQFDEPAFNVYMAEAADWGVQALERAAGVSVTAVVTASSSTSPRSRPKPPLLAANDFWMALDIRTKTSPSLRKRTSDLVGCTLTSTRSGHTSQTSPPPTHSWSPLAQVTTTMCGSSTVRTCPSSPSPATPRTGGTSPGILPPNWPATPGQAR